MSSVRYRTNTLKRSRTTNLTEQDQKEEQSDQRRRQHQFQRENVPLASIYPLTSQTPDQSYPWNADLLNLVGQYSGSLCDSLTDSGRSCLRQPSRTFDTTETVGGLTSCKQYCSDHWTEWLIPVLTILGNDDLWIQRSFEASNYEQKNRFLNPFHPTSSIISLGKVAFYHTDVSLQINPRLEMHIHLESTAVSSQYKRRMQRGSDRSRNRLADYPSGRYPSHFSLSTRLVIVNLDNQLDANDRKFIANEYLPILNGIWSEFLHPIFPPLYQFSGNQRSNLFYDYGDRTLLELPTFRFDLYHNQHDSTIEILHDILPRLYVAFFDRFLPVIQTRFQPVDIEQKDQPTDRFNTNPNNILVPMQLEVYLTLQIPTDNRPSQVRVYPFHETSLMQFFHALGMTSQIDEFNPLFIQSIVQNPRYDDIAIANIDNNDAINIQSKDTSCFFQFKGQYDLSPSEQPQQQSNEQLQQDQSNEQSDEQMQDID